MPAVDVTDATFATDVIERSRHAAVVVDLWAPWCGPCRTLGPIIEKVVDETDGDVVLVKVNVDENPQIAGAFQVQSIPAVYALRDGAVVDGFVGAYPEQVVREFVNALRPTDEENEINELLAKGDEVSFRAVLDRKPGHEPAVIGLAEVLVADGRTDEALQLLNRIPESAETRRVAALARIGTQPDDDYDARLAGLLDRVKADDEARREYVDILELMGPDDPRTASYRRQLTARLF
jgi:putative thioredoxin